MTFQEFLQKHNGKYLEVAGSSAQNQCVDLANGYIRDVLGLPIIEWTNARDFPSKGGDNYEYILNTPDGVPQEGDLIIWQHNQYGHIAVFVEGDANTFRSFDQNYPTGTPCHIQQHSYTSPQVAGWMRAKKVSTEMMQIDKTTFENLVDKATKLDELVPEFQRTKHLLSENERVNKEKDVIIKDLRQECGDLKNEKLELQKANLSLMEEKAALAEAAKVDAIHDRDAEIRNIDLEKELDKVKEEKVAPVEPVIEHYENIIEELWKNIIRGKRAKSWTDKFWDWIR